MPGSRSGASGDMAQAGAVDPFTGANRYRPSAGSTTSAGTAFGADPFTGTVHFSSESFLGVTPFGLSVMIMCTLYTIVSAVETHLMMNPVRWSNSN